MGRNAIKYSNEFEIKDVNFIKATLQEYLRRLGVKVFDLEKEFYDL